MFATCAARYTSAAVAVALSLHIFAASAQTPELQLGTTPGVRQEPTGSLSLRQALSLTLDRNPELLAYAWETRGADGRLLQAGLRPNPEVSVGVENFAGSGDLRGFKSAETTIQLSQLFELGGKRASRISSALVEKDLITHDFEIKRIELLAATSRAFIDVLAAQGRLEFSEEMVRLNDETTRGVQERVRAGRASPLEEDRARVTSASLRVELAKVRRNLESVRKTLSGMWGSPEPRFSNVLGSLSERRPLPALDQLQREMLAGNPELLRWTTEQKLRDANVAVEIAKGSPDVTLNAGVRRFEETRDNAFIVGVTIPIPVFNRNQGNTAEALAKAGRVESDRRVAALRLAAEMSAAYNAIVAAEEELRSLQADVVPGAERTFGAAQQSYQAGRLSFLEVLDAQRTFLSTRQQVIGAWAAYQQAWVDVDRLVGKGPVQVRGEAR